MAGNHCSDVSNAQQFFTEIEEELVSLHTIDSFEMLREIISYSDKLPDFPEQFRQEQYRVKGCQSTVFVRAQLQDGCITFAAFSDAQVLRGYLGILLAGLNGMHTDEFLQHARALVEGFARRTNIAASVSPTRANAFGNIFALMESQVRELAGKQ